jgi:hypothetical protein
MILVLVLLLACPLFAAEQAQTAKPAEATAVAPPAAAPATDSFHNPAPWLEQGADFRFREHYGYNYGSLNSEATDLAGNDASRFHWERYRTRLWDKFKLDESTSINTRFTWEFKTWDEPEAQQQDTDLDEIIMDNFNLSMKKFLDMPVTATVGRQDITDLGQGWLVMDGTPLDGSRTFYFDALRFTWNLGEKTKLDTIYIRNMPNSDWWLKPINDRHKYVTQEEEQGAIVYYTDKSSPTTVEGYFMYKNNNPVNPMPDNGFNSFSQASVDAYSKKADIYTLGGALSGPVINDNWNYRVEGAVQTGKSESPNAEDTPNHETENLLAFGEKSTLEYSFKDDLDNKLHVTYEYLSGDDPGTDRVTAFNPLWGQWPQWSEMLQGPYVNSMEDKTISNMHRLDFGHKFKPNKQWEILTDWNFLWAPENTYEGNSKFSNDGNFRGNLITCWARYAFSKNVSGNLVGEYFMPGNYYGSDNRDDALYFHWTITYTF